MLATGGPTLSPGAPRRAWCAVVQRELRTAYARYLAVTNAGAADVAPTVVGRGSTTQCRGNGQHDRRRDIDDTSNDCVSLGYLAGEDRVIEAVVARRGHLTLQGYRGDRGLGLGPVGRLAFRGSGCSAEPLHRSY